MALSGSLFLLVRLGHRPWRVLFAVSNFVARFVLTLDGAGAAKGVYALWIALKPVLCLYPPVLKEGPGEK